MRAGLVPEWGSGRTCSDPEYRGIFPLETEDYGTQNLMVEYDPDQPRYSAPRTPEEDELIYTDISGVEGQGFARSFSYASSTQE